MSTYVADGPDDKPHKRNSVQLAIRKLTYAPEEPAPQPSAEAFKEFLMSPGNLRLEATLDKEVTVTAVFCVMLVANGEMLSASSFLLKVSTIFS